MAWRWGFGPVFHYEWLLASRRWQMYAGRCLFVSVLLAGLLVGWWSATSQGYGNVPAVRVQALIGQQVFFALMGTQLALVLLAAPAATAGAVCHDKTRGLLAHLFMTDLSDTEIVLGKLASRLVPVCGYVFCSLPLVALCFFLGGIDPGALLGMFLVTLAVAILSCALAFMLSVWATKAHEVLMATYVIFIALLLAFPLYWVAVWLVFGTVKPPLPVLTTLEELSLFLNPFWVAFMPYWRPGRSWVEDQLLFVLVSGLLSAALVALAILRLRRVATRQTGRSAAAASRWYRRWPARLASVARWLPRATLDHNPILWREWRHRQASPWSRFLWWCFATATSALSVLTIYDLLPAPNRFDPMPELVTGLQVAIGFLLVSIGSVTSVAEERVQGSLDLLLTTPISVRTLLWGKWWGCYRLTLLLAFWPTMITGVFAAVTLHTLPSPPFASPPVASLAILDRARVATVYLMMVLLLSFGALVTSLGQFLAIRSVRIGRAMAISVTVYALIAIGWPFLAESLVRYPWERPAVAGSPLVGVVLLIEQGIHDPSDQFVAFLVATGCWCLVYLVSAFILMAINVHTFDRRMGRVVEEDRRHWSVRKALAELAPPVSSASGA